MPWFNIFLLLVDAITASFFNGFKCQHQGVL